MSVSKHFASDTPLNYGAQTCASHCNMCNTLQQQHMRHVATALPYHSAMCNTLLHAATWSTRCSMCNIVQQQHMRHVATALTYQGIMSNKLLHAATCSTRCNMCNTLQQLPHTKATCGHADRKKASSHTC